MEIMEMESEKNLDFNQVRVEVKAIGVNYADCTIRLGLYKSAKDHKEYKNILGFDFSGIVKEVGNKVKNINIGDRVFGITLFGAYQTEIIIDENYLFILPEKISFETGASLPTTYLTAYHILHNLAHIKKEESIFIHSIAGGVGNWLTLLSQRAGLEIYGDVSTKDKKKLLLEKGINNIEIRGSKEFDNFKFDVIANAQGGRSIKEDIKKLKTGGRLIIYGFHGMIHTTKNGKLSLSSWIKILYEMIVMPKVHPFTLVNENKSIMGCNLSYLFNEIEFYREAMDKLISILNESTTELPSVTKIPFNEVGRAHYLLEHSKTTGKLVLIVD
jgi:NADPH:quinone reductase-like Zn-dependent oxidoreductase